MGLNVAQVGLRVHSTSVEVILKRNIPIASTIGTQEPVHVHLRPLR